MKCLSQILDEARAVYTLSPSCAKAVGYGRTERQDPNRDLWYVQERVMSHDKKVLITRSFTTNQSGGVRDTRCGQGAIHLYVGSEQDRSDLEFDLLDPAATAKLEERLMIVFAPVFRGHEAAKESLRKEREAAAAQLRAESQEFEKQRTDRAYKLAESI